MIWNQKITSTNYSTRSAQKSVPFDYNTIHLQFFAYAASIFMYAAEIFFSAKVGGGK